MPQVGHTPWIAGLLDLYIVAKTVIEKGLLKFNVGMQIILALAVSLVVLYIHPVKGTTAAMETLAAIGMG